MRPAPLGNCWCWSEACCGAGRSPGSQLWGRGQARGRFGWVVLQDSGVDGEGCPLAFPGARSSTSNSSASAPSPSTARQVPAPQGPARTHPHSSETWLWPWWRLAPHQAAPGAESCPGPVGSSTTRPCWLGVCVACRRVCTAYNPAVCLHGAKPGDSGGGHAAGRASTGCCSPPAAPSWPCHLPVPVRVMRLCLRPSSSHMLRHLLACRSPRGQPPHAGMASALTCSWPFP